MQRKPYILATKLLLGSLILAATALVAKAQDEFYFQDFSAAAADATDLDDGSMIASNNGLAKTVTDPTRGVVLQLTNETAFSTLSSFVLPELQVADSGFVFGFEYQIGPPNLGQYADGFALSFGDGPSTDATNSGEEGYNKGISIEFDTFLNTDSAGDIVGHTVAVDGVDVANGTNPTAPHVDGSWHAVLVEWDGFSMTVSVDGSPLFENLEVSYIPQDGDQFAFTARTGGVTETLLIDEIDVRITTQPGLPGDFNLDGELTLEDIKLLEAEIATGDDNSDYNSDFDLNFDGTVDREDLPVLITGLLRLPFGDTNADREVTSRDVVIAFQAGTYGTGNFSSWTDGDWNITGLFDEMDLTSLSSAATYETTGTDIPGGSIATGGSIDDDKVTLIYNTYDGSLNVEVPPGVQLTTLEIVSSTGLFTGQKPATLNGFFGLDVYKPTRLFKLDPAGFTSADLSEVLSTLPSTTDLTSDLTVDGSRLGGGDLGQVDIMFITGYPAWAAANIPAGKDASFDADADGDGTSNGLTYAFDGMPIEYPAAGVFTAPADPPVYLELQRSEDLTNWRSVVVWDSGEIIVEGDNVDFDPFFVRDSYKPVSGKVYWRFVARLD